MAFPGSASDIGSSFKRSHSHCSWNCSLLQRAAQCPCGPLMMLCDYLTPDISDHAPVCFLMSHELLQTALRLPCCMITFKRLLVKCSAHAWGEDQTSFRQVGCCKQTCVQQWGAFSAQLPKLILEHLLWHLPILCVRWHWTYLHFSLRFARGGCGKPNALDYTMLQRMLGVNNSLI